VILAPFVIAVVPLAMKLLGFLGLDPITRSWCKLQPLRQAMRTVVPECVFDFDDDEPGRRKSELQLHHTVVEIRDAILGLRPYFREVPDHDIRVRWPNALLHVRAERTYDQVATDIESGRADIAAVAAWGPQPDFIKRLPTDAPLNDSYPTTFCTGGAHGCGD
jgi:hypothetical protein